MIRVPERWQSPTNGEPLDCLWPRPTVARAMAIIGTEDPYTPPATSTRSRRPASTVVRYEGAEHGFVHDPSRPAHRADDAADAWSRVLTFLST